MKSHERRVRFQEVDAARMAFFPNYLVWAHEGMERLMDDLAGGYVGLVRDRGIGLPAVALVTEFRSPLAFGDSVRVDTAVERIGTRSLVFVHRFTRLRDGSECALVRQTVVTTDLAEGASCDMPADVRALAELHAVRESGA